MHRQVHMGRAACAYMSAVDLAQHGDTRWTQSWRGECVQELHVQLLCVPVWARTARNVYLQLLCHP